MAKPNQAHEQTMEEILASIRRMISDDPTAKPSLAEAVVAAGGASPVPAPVPAGNISRLFVVDEAKPSEAPPAEPPPVAEPEIKPAAASAASDNVVELAIAQAIEEAHAEMRDGAILKEAPPAEVKREIHIDLGLDVKEEAPIVPVAAASQVAAAPEPALASRPREPLAPPVRRQRYVAAPLRTTGPVPEPLAGHVPPLMSPGTDAAVAAAFSQLASTMLSGGARTVDELVADLVRPMLRDWLDDNLPPMVERLVREEIERVARGRR